MLAGRVRAPRLDGATQALDAPKLRGLLKGMMEGVVTTEKVFLQVGRDVGPWGAHKRRAPRARAQWCRRCSSCSVWVHGASNCAL